MLSFKIALRYFFSRKSHNAVNIISLVSVAGVAVATAAIVCVLSVFNGFRGMVENLFTAFDPPYKVVVVEGKTVAESDPVVQAILASDAVAARSLVLEENALVSRDGRQLVVTVKGVDDSFTQVSGIDTLLYGIGEYMLHADVLQFGILGAGVAGALGLGAEYDGALDVYAPRPGSQINMANPAASFRHDELYSPGVVFSVRQAKYDDNIIITSLPFARSLFSAPDRLSAIELALTPGASRNDIERLLDHRFRLLDGYEQQADVYRVMNMEKAVSYAFLSIIVLIVAFNIIGSLSMLILDKQDDMRTLRAMGTTQGFVRRVFFAEGMLTSCVGAVAGCAIGVALCLLQQRYGLIRLGGTQGSFITDAYPVALKATDIIVTFITVVAVSAIAIILPVRRIK